MTLSTHKGALHYGPTNFTSLTGAGTWELEIIRHHGNPNPLYIGTTLVERSITTIRQQLWRFTPITYGYTKKLLTLRAAFALYVANYNFARIHGSLRVTPAMAAGATRVWELERLPPEPGLHAVDRFRSIKSEERAPRKELEMSDGKAY